MLTVVASTIALANLSCDDFGTGDGSGFGHRSYGWPLIWHRFVHVPTAPGQVRTAGWYYNASRLAANLGLWLALLAATAGACEWWLRRYGLRWNLRKMLVAVALAGGFCAWFAAARSRAALQDPLIDQRGRHMLQFRVERSFPKWLDLIGADPFRRRIVSAEVGHLQGNENDEKLLQQLQRLPDLRRLSIKPVRLTRGMARTIGQMRQLRTLDIQHLAAHLDKPLLPAYMREIGKLTQLEHLTLANIARENESLACLAGLTNLKSLEIWGRSDDGNRMSPAGMAAIGQMTRLETLRLPWTAIDRNDLPHLGRLTDLKSLTLYAGAGDEWLSHDSLQTIGGLAQLEYLFLFNVGLHADSMRCLGGLANLKSLALVSVTTDAPSLLRRLPALGQLEALALSESQICDEDLRHLARLPRLKTLGLDKTSITGRGLAQLAALDSLDQLDLFGNMVSVAGLEALTSCKRLRRLHLQRDSGLDGYNRVVKVGRVEMCVPAEEFDRFAEALQALQTSKREMVIDSWPRTIRKECAKERYPSNAESIPQRDHTWLPRSNCPWMTALERANFQANGYMQRTVSF